MKKIAVVIVTFNSSKCIGRLLDKLLAQTYPVDRIIISDNNSTDSTCDIINGFKNSKIRLYQLGKNLGGAGGFAKCFDVAKNSDCDVIFSFDDDAYPPSDDFVDDMMVIKERGGYDVISPLVVDSDNHDLSAYEYRINDNKLTDVHSIQKLALLDDDIKLFNGVLFDKVVVEKIGVPRAEFFIRGDEQEYKMRILDAGFKTAVFTGQIIYHPTSLNEYFYIEGKRYHHLDSPFKLYYSNRNRFYMLRARQDWSILQKIRQAGKECWRYGYFYLIHRRLDVKNYALWLKSAFCGLLGRMNNDVFL